MTVKIGINGFGRIGRDVLRCVFDTLAHLLKYDSTYGTWQREVHAVHNRIAVNDKHFAVLSVCNRPNCRGRSWVSTSSWSRPASSAPGAAPPSI
jgi:glyceraldehyde-3-phosphate dehydrogenase/erythrose-4-phosphate dehydrogenase